MSAAPILETPPARSAMSQSFHIFRWKGGISSLQECITQEEYGEAGTNPGKDISVERIESLGAGKVNHAIDGLFGKNTSLHHNLSIWIDEAAYPVFAALQRRHDSPPP